MSIASAVARTVAAVREKLLPSSSDDWSELVGVFAGRQMVGAVVCLAAGGAMGELNSLSVGLGATGAACLALITQSGYARLEVPFTCWVIFFSFGSIVLGDASLRPGLALILSLGLLCFARVEVHDS